MATVTTAANLETPSKKVAADLAKFDMNKNPKVEAAIVRMMTMIREAHPEAECYMGGDDGRWYVDTFADFPMLLSGPCRTRMRAVCRAFRAIYFD